MVKSAPSAARLLWIVLVAAAVAVVLWPRPPGSRPAPREDVLLAADVPMESDGALFAFRVERPGVVAIAVGLTCGDPATTPATWAVVGPPGPVEAPAGNYYAPDPKSAHRWRVVGQATAPERRPFFMVGSYALKIEPIPVAMGEMPPRVRVRVTSEAASAH